MKHDSVDFIFCEISFIQFLCYLLLEMRQKKSGLEEQIRKTLDAKDALTAPRVGQIYTHRESVC